jgi:hypothetical protein
MQQARIQIAGGEARRWCFCQIDIVVVIPVNKLFEKEIPIHEALDRRI